MSSSHLREELSDLEHEQWMAWSKTILDRLRRYDLDGMPLHTAILTLEQRWQPNWIKYSELSEETKEYDREWADRTLDKVRKYIQ